MPSQQVHILVLHGITASVSHARYAAQQRPQSAYLVCIQAVAAFLEEAAAKKADHRLHRHQFKLYACALLPI